MLQELAGKIQQEASKLQNELNEAGCSGGAARVPSLACRGGLRSDEHCVQGIEERQDAHGSKAT